MCKFMLKKTFLYNICLSDVLIFLFFFFINEKMLNLNIF